MGGACGKREDAEASTSAVNASGLINWAVVGRNAEERQAIEVAVNTAQQQGRTRRASVQACTDELDAMRRAAGEDDLFNYRSSKPGDAARAARSGRRSSTTAFEEQYPVHGTTVASKGRQNVINRRASSGTRRPVFWAGEMEAKKSTDVR